MLVTEISGPTGSEQKKIIGIVRLNKIFGTKEAELKMIIVDRFHNLGLGEKMLEKAILCSQKEGIKNIHTHILQDNLVMVRLCEKLGFQRQQESLSHNIISMILKTAV